MRPFRRLLRFDDNDSCSLEGLIIFGMVINRIRCETTGYYVESEVNGGFVHHGGEMDQDVKVRVFCSVESTSYFKVAAVWAAENRYLKVRRRFYRRIGIGGEG